MICIDTGVHDENGGTTIKFRIRKLRMQDVEELFSKTNPRNKKFEGLFLNKTKSPRPLQIY